MVEGLSPACGVDDRWRKDDCQSPMENALAVSEVESLTFHELRHTYASGLVNRGIPLLFVAAQLGHGDTRMVEEHYGHLCKTAQREAIRQHSPVLGIGMKKLVEPLKKPVITQYEEMRGGLKVKITETPVSTLQVTQGGRRAR